MQIKGVPSGDPDVRLDETLEVGFVIWHQALASLRERGLKGDSGPSALAVALAAALISEGLTVDQISETLRMCLRLWRLVDSPDGPRLVFSCPLSPISGASGSADVPEN